MKFNFIFLSEHFLNAEQIQYCLQLLPIWREGVYQPSLVQKHHARQKENSSYLTVSGDE